MKVVVMKQGGFVYGKLPDGGEEYVGIGQILDTKGLRNDAQLLTLGYFIRHDPDMHDEFSVEYGHRTFTNEAYHQEFARTLERMEEERATVSFAERAMDMPQEEFERQELERRGIAPLIS